MRSRMKSYALVACLFVFLFVVVGAALHLNPMGAFVAALSGTPLVVYVAKRWSGADAGAAPTTGMRVASRSRRVTGAKPVDSAEDSDDLASRAS